MNAKTAGRAAPHACHRAGPGRPPAHLFRIFTGFAAALRRARLAVLPVALAVLVAVPMPATPQQGNLPVFSPSTARTFHISEGTGSGEVIGMLPSAMDEDQDDGYLDYSLWDRDDPIVQGSQDDQGYGDGDANAFDFEQEFYIDPDDEDRERKSRLALTTRVGHEYDFESEPPKRVYQFRLVACDNDYNRSYIDITVRIDNVNEDLGRPDAPTVVGVSTMKLVVRWRAPSNTGPPITDYNLEYRQKDPVGDWRSWSHSGPQTNAVIMSSNLLPDTDYEVQVLARNAEGSSPWSPPGTGRTKAASGNPPVFLESSPERSFPENTRAGRNIGGPVAAAGESTLEYSLEGSDAASFDVVSSSGGQIRTKAGVTYDYEAKSSYEVTVTAEDRGGMSAPIAVTIRITDVLEPPERPAAPVVATESDTSLSVSWTARVYTDRPPITSHDLQYRRGTSGGWTAGPQNVTGTSRTITDLESGTQYQVQILARNDEGESPWSPPGSGRTNVTGNNLPVFPSTAPDLSFDESVGNERKQVMDVGQPVTANDPGDPLRYSLEGDDKGSFSIDSSTGQIKTRSMVYDFETKPSYSVAVKATDSHRISDTIALTISLINEAEPPLAPRAPSVSGHSTKSLSVNWNPPSDNRGRPDIVDYDLQYRECPSNQCPSAPEMGWSNGPEGVDDTSAVIQDVTPPLNPDTRYQLRVRATNDEGDGAWSPPGSGRTLSPPTFPAGPLARSFQETVGAEESASRNVGAPVRAMYAGGMLTYSLGGDDAGLFDIDEETGQIKTRLGGTYDYEAQPPVHPYSVTVKASDASNSSASVDVTITITDANERPLAPGTPDISAVSGSTTSLSVAWMAPDDAGRPPTTSYDVQYRQGIRGSWHGVPQEDVSGTSATITGLNEGTLYQVQVRAINDEGNGPYSQPGAGATNMENPVSNTPPTFDEDASTTRMFPENTPPNRNIGAPVKASDADVTDPNKDDTLIYSLSGTDAASFNIDYATGQLRTKSGVTYDFEIKASYMVTVRATDMSNASATIDVTINLTDVDESGGGNGGGGGGGGGNDGDENTRNAEDEESGPNDPPVFEDVLINRSFPENTPPGQPIGAPVTATDEDGDPLTYTLEGPDAGLFDIDASTGQLRTKAGVDYDYETRPALYGDGAGHGPERRKRCHSGVHQRHGRARGAGHLRTPRRCAVFPKTRHRTGPSGCR